MTTLIPKVDFKNGGTTPTGAINRPINQKLQETISVLDFGAIGNGSTDDTTAISNAIAATPTGGTLLFPAGYSFLVNVLTITKSNITLQLDGILINGTTLTPPPQLHTGSPSYGAPPSEVSNYPAIYLNGGSNICITGSGSISTPWYEGIKVNAVTNLIIEGITIYGVRSTNLSSILRGAWDAIWMTGCTNVIIQEVKIHDIGGIRQAVLDQRWSGNPYGVSGNCVTINSSSIITIQNCYFHDYAWQGIYPMDCHNIKILNNTLENGTGSMQINALGDYSSVPMDFTIDGNSIYNMSGNGMDISVGSTTVTLAAGKVTNNTIRYCGYLPDMTGQFDGAYISLNAPGTTYISDVTFSNNSLEQGCVSYGVYLAACQNIVFSSNTIRKTGQMAFQLGLTANINISDNTCQEITSNFITLSSASTNPYLIVDGNIVNMAGYPVVAVSGATALGSIFSNNKFVNTSAINVDIALSNVSYVDNYFGPNITFSKINGSNIRFIGNYVYETATFVLASSIVSENTFNDGLSLPDTIDTTISNNIVNSSSGNYNLSIFTGSLSRQPTKLSVMGNVIYPNTGGTAISSNATYSVFANVINSGSSSISGTGTTVLY